ncbi:peptidylprolyl isomerase ESS1 [Ascoidea rubescens DSM 1968]|uniref:Peptidyl-prolyl cis-trans isomerase n=1 Tax=Ascoidea rubescens DSM 1968 TaxID=1344418 RepID=A0A1D2V9S2_9ASCO|nr:peptidyl-prolyl cis-trans isomerase ssp-1 [Ascoidea rubescens DSM 1968]ODV58285.1 peptidyl-prolyl cis-trans isomerase ssp-1 [Ascoidea rubescens DSM 1968]
MSGNETGLPADWILLKSRSHNRHYFHNPTTKQSVWDAPDGTDVEMLKRYLADQSHKSSSSSHSHNHGGSHGHRRHSQGERIRCNHLLIKHRDSRNPKSWKNSSITISKEEAIQKLKVFEQKIKNGETSLSELAKTESDCGSHLKGGDLGFFTRGMMQPSFEKAAFALHVGEISGIVESNSGVHLIERVA